MSLCFHDAKEGHRPARIHTSLVPPMLHVLAQRGFDLLSNEADFLSRVAGMSWHCPSVALLLACIPSPGSEYVFLAQPSN